MEVHNTVVIFVVVLWSSREHVTIVSLSLISLAAIKGYCSRKYAIYHGQCYPFKLEISMFFL